MMAAKVAFTGCDCFHLAIDAMMRRAGQGAHQVQAVLELAGDLDASRLEAAVDRLAATYPILCGRLKRSVLGLPYWRIEPGEYHIPVEVWDVRGANADGAAVDEVLQDRLNDPLDPARGRNLRVDVVQTKERTFVGATWAHTLLDARGAEYLLARLAALADDGAVMRPVTRGEAETSDTRSPDPAAPAGAATPVITPPEALGPSLGERLWSRTTWRRLRRAQQWLSPLAEVPFRSLGGPEGRPGPARYQVITLGSSETARVFERARRLCGALSTMPFFLTVATRAHEAVFVRRKIDPGAYVLSIPAQMRPRGTTGPIFQNHVSVLFFHLTRADIVSVEAALAVVRRQFVVMVRDRLDECFATALELARRVPSVPYLAGVRRMFSGEIASFFHSYTGAFAPGLQTFCGIPVVNAYHAPGVSSPPGTGVFVSEWGGRLNVTLSWRDGVLTPAEVTTLGDAVVRDLCG